MVNGSPNPTGTGRYCMPAGTCYCGGCAHYRPLPERDWSRVETPGKRQPARGRARGRR